MVSNSRSKKRVGGGKEREKRLGIYYVRMYTTDELVIIHPVYVMHAVAIVTRSFIIL